MSTRSLLAVVALSSLVSGCFSFRFRDVHHVPGETHSIWTDHFLWGLAGHEVVDVREFCESGEAAEVATGSNFGTWFVSFITLGIYSPKKVYVTCSAGYAEVTP